MKKLTTTLFILAVIALVACLVSSVCAETLAGFRWGAMTISNISVNGTPQITTAHVDSFVVWADKTVGTDFALTPYNTNEALDTFVTTFTTSPANRDQQYTLASDFIPGQLLWAIRKGQGDGQFYAIDVGLPPKGTPKPTNEDKLSTVWDAAGVLNIQPATQSADSIIICYRALPTAMTDSDSETEVGAPLHRMIIVLAAADIAKKLHNVDREMALRAEYAAFKAERLVLPAAALSGGGVNQ